MEKKSRFFQEHTIKAIQKRSSWSTAYDSKCAKIFKFAQLLFEIFQQKIVESCFFPQKVGYPECQTHRIICKCNDKVVTMTTDIVSP